TVGARLTPATGPRLLVRADLEREALAARLLEGLEERAASHGLSGAHALFLDEPARAACLRRGWLLRRDCQFHWSNRGYTSFDDYLATFTAEKRKKARRERRRVAEAGVRFETRFGGELDEELLERIYALHRDTFVRHGHEPYLARAAGRGGVVSAPRAGAGRAERTAGGGRRPLARASHRGLPARDLPLVLAGAAGAVVVTRSARGAVPGGVPLHAQPREDAAQRRLHLLERSRLRRRHRRLRRAARRQSRHLDHLRHARRLPGASPPRPRAQRRGVAHGQARR